MLEVHQKYEKLIAYTFNNDPLFLSALDKACASVINKRLSDKQPCRSAELVSVFFSIFVFYDIFFSNQYF